MSSLELFLTVTRDWWYSLQSTAASEESTTLGSQTKTPREPTTQDLEMLKRELAAAVKTRNSEREERQKFIASMKEDALRRRKLVEESLSECSFFKKIYKQLRVVHGRFENMNDKGPLRKRLGRLLDISHQLIDIHGKWLEMSKPDDGVDFTGNIRIFNPKHMVFEERLYGMLNEIMKRAVRTLKEDGKDEEEKDEARRKVILIINLMASIEVPT